MKKIMMLTLSALFLGSMAMAVDAKNDVKESMDHSKNPITGSETTTKKYTKKSKTENGSEQDVSVTEKTKVSKDGTVKKSVEVDGDSTKKH